MILKNVAIESFGGLTGKILNLEDGLNIILGPNESGKSTIFNALCHCLFTSTKQTPKQFEKQMQRFVPVTGGDTIAVSLDFECKGQPYTLQRSWGATKASSLILPEGSKVSDPNKINETIEACLMVSEATSKSVMLAYQSSLSQTLDNLENDDHTLATLGDILRKSIMEMDGVSIDVLKSRIEDDYENYFSRWDREAQYPENNKGIQNPYKTSLGEIIKAFYSKERIRVDLEAAFEQEKELDAINQNITDCVSVLKEKEGYIERFKAAKEDAQKRRQLESDLKACDLEYSQLEKVNQEWPVQRQKLKGLDESIPKLEVKGKKLEAVKEKIQAFNRNQALVEKFDRVRTKKKLHEAAHEVLRAIKKIAAQDVAAMRKIESTLKNLEASMSAGTMHFNLETRETVDVTIQQGLQEEATLTVTPENPVSMMVEGRLQVSHPDWRMSMSPGEIDFNDMQSTYETLQKDLSSLFKQHEVTDVAQAEKQSTAYRDGLQKVEHAKKSFDDELGDDDYESLENTAAKFRNSAPGRDIDTVVTELVEVQKELGLSKKEGRDLKFHIEQHKNKYGSSEKLLDLLLDVRGRKNKAEQTLSSLTPLPDGEDDPDSFLRKYAKAEEDVKKLREDRSELLKEKIRLEFDNPPDRSVEEFEKDLVEAQEQFEEVLRHGEAVARIQETVYDLLEDADSETYSTLEDDVAELVSEITDNKYTQIDMDESLPTGFKLAGGETVSYDLLSTGTQDVLAIALRLAFAREFLGEEKSFIMLDDPLVDLDPERQTKAAEVIQSFSKDHQVILFTCHPSHADKLGGALIDL